MFSGNVTGEILPKVVDDSAVLNFRSGECNNVSRQSNNVRNASQIKFANFERISNVEKACPL